MKWLKRFLIFLFIIFVLAIIAGIYFIKTFDVADYKDEIEQNLSAQINREVAIGDIALDFSFKDGLNLKLEGLSVEEEPARENDYILKVDYVHLGVDLMAFVKQREIKIFGVTIGKPEIYLVKEPDGTLNIEGPLSTVQKDQKPVLKKETKKTTESKAVKKEEFNVFINAINITDARIYYVDKSEPVKTVDVHSLDLSINGFSLGKDFDFHLQFGLLHSQPNVFADGVAFINPVLEEVIVKNAKISTELGNIDLIRLAKLIPENEQIKEIEKLGGTLNVNFQDLKIAKGQMEKADISINVTDGLVKMANLEKPIDQVQLSGNIDETKLIVKELTFYYGNGQGQLGAVIENYLLAPSQEFDISLNSFLAEEILSSFEIPINIEGKINGQLKAQAQGMTPEMLQQTLIGDGTWKMTDGLIKDINVLKMVLSKLSFIPNLVAQIEEKLPPAYKEKLKAKDTVLNLVETDMNMNGGKLYFSNTKVDADGFVLDLNGDIDFNQYLNLNASFSIPFELSQIMVASVPDLSFLLDGNNIIRIPLKSYSGKLDKFMIYPDIGDMAQKVMRSRGKEELQKVIFKALDLDEEPQEGQVDQQGAVEGEQVPAETKPPEQEAIEGILDMIFK